MSDHHVVSPALYYRIFAVLLILTMLTVVVAFFDLGEFNTVVAITIAVTKALFVILFFMHVRYSSYLTWIFAGAGFFWLLLLIALTMSDYLTRSWLVLPGQ